MKYGLVSLVGAGPGNPGLLTLAGRDRLAAADVVVYDRLVNPEILAHARKSAELLYAGKSPAGHTLTQDDINALLVERARAGKRVVRLKGGDPFVFGRGGEEGLALAVAGIAFEVIPGVTSAVAAPAYAGVPVSHRGVASSFAVVTGHEDDTKEEQSVDWARLALAVDTLVVLMGGAALESIARQLIEAGRDPDTPAVSVQWGTTPEQRSVAAPLRDIYAAVSKAGLGTPLLTVIGNVARLRDEGLNWFEAQPLFGKRVLVTRTREQSSVLSRLLRERGAVPVEVPTLELVPAEEANIWASVRALGLKDYDWCLFTSANAVEHYWRSVVGVGWDARVFKCLIAAIGPATAEALKAHSLVPDLVATDSTSAGLLDALTGWARRNRLPETKALQGARFLYPRAADASDVLAEGLREGGATVDEVILYEARIPQARAADVEAVRNGRVDIVTFASSSAVRNLATLLGPDFERLRDAIVACIGPVTAATAREFGLRVDVEAREQSVEALVDALCDHFRAGNG